MSETSEIVSGVQRTVTRGLLHNLQIYLNRNLHQITLNRNSWIKKLNDATDPDQRKNCEALINWFTGLIDF